MLQLVSHAHVGHTGRRELVMHGCRSKADCRKLTSGTLTQLFSITIATLHDSATSDECSHKVLTKTACVAFGTGSMSSSGEDDEQDWSDWGDECDEESTKSLFSDIMLKSAQQAIVHDAREHGFDLGRFRAEVF